MLEREPTELQTHDTREPRDGARIDRFFVAPAVTFRVPYVLVVLAALDSLKWFPSARRICKT